MLQLFVETADPSRCGSVRRVICSGEALPADLAGRFLALVDCELHNLYGPTEAAVDATAWESRLDPQLSSVPIGRPIANTQIYVLDQRLEPVPIGVSGDLYIGGVQVAQGYLNRPELTAERFVDDPFRPGRIYRTGDLARWNDDGVIEFLGRSDDQVKIRGFRIELEEIEAQLAGHEGVSAAAVVPIQTDSGPVLAAFVVPTAAGHGADGRVLRLKTELREYLRTKLPDYMVPAAFVFLDSLPVTSSGKVDRNALPEPDQNRLETEESYVARHTC